MESHYYQHQYRRQGTGIMDESTLSTNCNGASSKAHYHNGTSKQNNISSPDVIEKDSRNGGIGGNIYYPPSMHDIVATRPVFLLSRSPVLDNEKDMTRTPTTPRSPPTPVTASPTNGHDGKMAPGDVSTSTSVLSRGAHLPSYHGTSSSTMSTSSSSMGSESGNGGGGGYVGASTGTARPQPRTNYPPTTTSATTNTGHRLSSHHYGAHGQQGMAGGGVGRGGGGGMPHPYQHGDPRYRRTGHQYDARYNRTQSSSVAAAMYNQPAQAYSTYPSESYMPYRSNYSRPLSTGSLSSITTASSRPGFSSLDEFPTMYDRRSTFAPSGAAGEASQPRHHNSAGATYGGGGGGGDSRYYPSHPYRQFHDHFSSSGGYVGASSPLSPYDEHQPLLSLSVTEQQHQQQRRQQQSGSAMLLGESSSDELGGQTISEELSRKLNLHDPRTTSQPEAAKRQPQQSMAGSNFDEGANCILILEHPRDIEVLPNERAVLRCTARISRRGHGRSQSKEERLEEEEEEPNLLWYKDAEPLIGEIDCEFVVDKVTERDIGVYYCLVSHPALEHIQRQSNVARLTIKRSTSTGGGETEPEEAASDSSAPEIVEQPPNEVAAVIDEKLLIPLKATGAQLSFRWYKDNKELRYADGPVLRIPSARYSDSGVYCCSISNKFGSVLSKNSLIKVTQVRGTDSSAQPQPGFKRPTSIYDWGDQPLSDAFLRDVGKAVARQTTNLNRIALYLGLRNPDIVEINQHFHIPEEQAFHMLRLWSQGQRRERSTLKIILTQAGIKLDLLAAGASRKPTVKPPKIAVHPKNTQVVYGHRLDLSVQVDPSEPAFSLQYQWYRNGKPLGGKTDPNIMISSATNGDIGEYYCVVSKQSERTVSNVAKVDVVNPHVSTPTPLSSMGPTVAASSAFINPSSAQPVGPGGSYLKGQWGHEGRYGGRGGPNEPNRRDDHHHQAPPTMGGDFLSRGGEREAFEASDEQPSGQPVSGVGWNRPPGDTEANEKAVLLSQQQVSTSHLKPQILEHPQSQQVEAGDPLTLRCSAMGVGQLGYMWYFNGLSLAGEDRPEYEINCFTDEDEGLYQCKVQSTHGEVLSRMAHIQMRDDGSD